MQIYGISMEKPPKLTRLSQYNIRYNTKNIISSLFRLYILIKFAI